MTDTDRMVGDWLRVKKTTRREAQLAGEKIYLGRPCKHGHEGYRYTSNMHCVDCLTIANEARDKAAHNAANLRRYYLKRMTVLMGKMEALGARG